MDKCFIDIILGKVCVDNRIQEGIFLMDVDTHMEVLQEYFVKYGISEHNSVVLRNKILEGRFPERQAYNKDGLLVTFPTPEYKQRAISRGTHFEENPRKGQTNVFQTPQQPGIAPAPTAPAQPSGDTAQAEPTSNLSPSELQPKVATQSSTQPAPAPTEPKKDERTPKEKSIDAAAVQQILGSAPSSIDIALKYPNLEENFITEKNGMLCDFNGLGKKWYCESTGKFIISK